MVMAETIVLLHGFGGTCRTWDGVVARLDGERYRPLALDLRGHGAARDALPIGFVECCVDILAAAPGRFALCGYSMGGRIAQHVALAAPERISRLVLVSTTAGLDDPVERAERVASDAALAGRIERETIEEFVARWRAQPLFAEDPPWVAALARADHRRNDPARLATAMRALSTGMMEPLWGRLTGLRVPTVVLAGERDRKFCEIGERLAATLPDARLQIVPGAGHAVHLETPEVVAEVLDREQGRFSIA
jgi:2-succinyl-6-hydroxy-2,4-cyclohexadiene-1-carboxylate synthase